MRIYLQLTNSSENKVNSFVVGPSSYTTDSSIQKNKNNCEVLDIQVYDHWSSDTKQVSAHRNSCFELVFTTMGPKPLWVKIISDNEGPLL